MCILDCHQLHRHSCSPQLFLISMSIEGCLRRQLCKLSQIPHHRGSPPATVDQKHLLPPCCTVSPEWVAWGGVAQHNKQQLSAQVLQASDCVVPEDEM